MLESKPKIAVVANTAWNIINFRMGLMNKLRDTGYEMIAIAPEDEYSLQIERAGFKFIALKNLDRKGTNPIKDLKLVFELRRIYRQEGIQMALHYTIKPNVYGTFAAKTSGTKAICTVTGLGYSFLANNWVSRLARTLYKYAFRNAAFVAFQNNDDRLLFIESKLVKKEKTLLIRGSGINCDQYRPLEKSIASDQFIFLFVGRLLLDKGIREFLAAAEKIKIDYPNAQCQIVGKIDTDNPSCIGKTEIDDAQLNNIVQYFGPSDQVLEYIRNADCVVLPSYREGLPRVMLEAISMAKPIITTDAPGCRDTVVDGENGFMVPIRDMEALYNAMKKIISCDTETLKKMGLKGRELALNEFDEAIVFEKYIDLVKILIQ